MHTIPYCYLLPVTEAACHASVVPSHAFALPSLQVRFRSVVNPLPIDFSKYILLINFNSLYIFLLGPL